MRSLLLFTICDINKLQVVSTAPTVAVTKNGLPPWHPSIPVPLCRMLWNNQNEPDSVAKPASCSFASRITTSTTNDYVSPCLESIIAGFRPHDNVSLGPSWSVINPLQWTTRKTSLPYLARGSRLFGKAAEERRTSPKRSRLGLLLVQRYLRTLRLS